MWYSDRSIFHTNMLMILGIGGYHVKWCHSQSIFGQNNGNVKIFIQFDANGS